MPTSTGRTVTPRRGGISILPTQSAGVNVGAIGTYGPRRYDVGIPVPEQYLSLNFVTVMGTGIYSTLIEFDFGN